MKGVLNLYKPRGITSSDAVSACRKILGTRAVGHMGTLDPAGEGVLPIGVGKATRLFSFYLQKDKVYEAEFSFGYETDTLDGDGTVITRTEVLPLKEQICDTLPTFLGTMSQIPPDYSAKSVDGVRAYALARAGKSVSLSACDVTIYEFVLLRQTGEHTYLFRIHCSSGTYIRSLCRDLAKKLGSLATMVSIKRVRCGSFCIEDSVTLEALAEHKERALISVETAVSSLPVVTLSDDMYAPLCNGIKIPCDQEDMFALYCKGELFGIAHGENGILKIKTYLRD